MTHVKIREPFWGAGSSKTYNWQKDGYHIHGIGIDMRVLQGHESLTIEVLKQIFEVKTAPLLEFIAKYKSTERIKNSDVVVGVFSRSLLPWKTPPPKPVPQTEPWWKPKPVDMDTKIAELAKDFKPAFGNQDHIQIASNLADIERLKKNKQTKQTKDEITNLQKQVLYLLGKEIKK